MKIISKYKDYYDYLSGIYGIDEKIVLDRRNSQIPKLYKKDSFKFTIFLCGLSIDGLHKGDNFYYGEDLKQFERKVPTWYYKFEKKSEKFVYINCENTRHKSEKFYTEPIKDDKHTNDKLDCPIVLSYDTNYKFPILSNMNLQTMFSPDDVYQLLYQWVSNKITKKENKTDNRTDVEKLLSKGFDKKKSFRGRIPRNN